MDALRILMVSKQDKLTIINDSDSHWVLCTSTSKQSLVNNKSKMKILNSRRERKQFHDIKIIAQSAGVLENANSLSAEGQVPINNATSVLYVTLSHLIVRL